MTLPFCKKKSSSDDTSKGATAGQASTPTTLGHGEGRLESQANHRGLDSDVLLIEYTLRNMFGKDPGPRTLAFEIKKKALLYHFDRMFM